MSFSGVGNSCGETGFLPPDEGAHASELRSVPSAVFLLCCMSLGVGVFMMPTVFNAVGWPTGVFLLLFFGFFSTLMMLLSLEVLAKTDCKDSDEFADIVPGMRILSTLGMIIAPTIANAAHLQLVSGMLFDILSWWITGDYGDREFQPSHKIILLSIFVGVALPWTFMTNLGALRHVGKAVSGVIILTSVAVVTSCVVHVSEGKGATGEDRTPAGLPDVVTLIQQMPTVCFAFSSMFSLFEVFGALRRGAQEQALPRMRRAVIASGTLITVLYLVVGLACVWSFGKLAGGVQQGNGDGNVLYNFPPENYPVTILCVFLIVAIMLDYPIINYPTVSTLLRLNIPGMKWPYARHALSIFFGAVVITIDMAIPNLGAVFGLCGSLGITLFCYIVPGAVVLRAGGGVVHRVVGAFSILVGVFMLVFGTFFIIKGLVEPPSTTTYTATTTAAATATTLSIVAGAPWF